MELNYIMFTKVTIIFAFIGLFVGLYNAWKVCNEDFGMHIVPFICLPLISIALFSTIPAALFGVFYAVWFLLTK
jgi:hypothetical protein